MSDINVNITDEIVNVNVIDEIIEVNVNNAPGIPSGGNTGQVLKKLSNTDYDTYWAADTQGVPYVGATGNVDLGEYELKAGQVEFDQSPTGTAGVGVMRWNDTDGTLDLGLKGGSVTLQVGEDIVARVVNKTGSNLLASNYQVVKVSSAQGQRLAINFAQANNDNNSADTIGLVAENISNNQEGWIQILGQLTEINTTGSLQGETWTDGDVLYLSPTTAGSLTNVKPVAPQHIVVLGYVEYAHSQHGKIYVKVMNGWELGELHDVDTTGATNGQALTYNSSLGIWQPSTISTNNIYNSNGTLTANRTLTSGGFNLTFTGSNTASGAIARGLLLNHTLVAAANNDVLVGLDINPTFTNGAFTGVTNLSARIFGDLRIQGTSANFGNAGFYMRSNTGNSHALFFVADSILASTVPGFGIYDMINARTPFAIRLGAPNNSFYMFANGNILLQNAGTATDAGFRLDVNGTSRFQDRVLISPTIATTNSILKLTDNTNGTTWAGFSTQTTTVGFFIGTNNALTIGRGTTADNTAPTGSQMNFRSSGVYLELTTNSANQGISFSDGNNATIRMNFPSSNEAALTTTTSQNLSIGTASNTSAAVTNTIKFFGSTNNVAIGSTTDNLAKLQVSGSITASSAIARGTLINTTLTAAANNDVLVGLDINPTFTNGAFTGVSNYGLRLINSQAFFGGLSSVAMFIADQSAIRGNATTNGTIYIDASRDLTGTMNLRATTISLGAATTSAQQINCGGLLVSSLNTVLELRGTGIPKFRINNPTSGTYWDFENHRSAPSGSLEITNSLGVPTLTLFSTRNIGVNTFTDAGFKLDVNGTARVQTSIQSPIIYGGSGATSALQLTGTSGNGTATAEAIQMFVGNNGASRGITILNNGNTSIGGVPSASYKLDVTGALNVAGNISTINNTGLQIKTSGGTITDVLYADTSNNIILGANAAGWSSIQFRNGSATAQMIITSVGSVGIGTTSPTAALDTPASTTARASLRIRSGTAPTTPNDGDIWFDGTDLKIRIGGVTKTFTVT